MPLFFVPNRVSFITVTIDEAFAAVGPAFSNNAEWQGTHFRYAVRNGTVILEVKRFGRFFYWLLVDERFLLIHASEQSKLGRLQTIDASLAPSPTTPTTRR